MFLRRRHKLGERGAALVEMLLVMPILLVLAFNVADAGWAYAQQNAVQGMAREAARVAATQPGLDAEAIAAAVCSHVDRVDPETITLSFGGLSAQGTSTVVVTADYTPLTDSPLSALRGLDSLDTELEFRVSGSNLNPPPVWSGGSDSCPG